MVFGLGDRSSLVIPSTMNDLLWRQDQHGAFFALYNCKYCLFDYERYPLQH